MSDSTGCGCKCTATQTTAELDDCDHGSTYVLGCNALDHDRHCIWVNGKWKRVNVADNVCAEEGADHRKHCDDSEQTWTDECHGATPHAESEPYAHWEAGARPYDNKWRACLWSGGMVTWVDILNTYSTKEIASSIADERLRAVRAGEVPA